MKEYKVWILKRWIRSI